MADESIISYSDLIGKDNTFKDLDKEIAKLEKRLQGLAKAFNTKADLVNPNDIQKINELDKELQELTQTKKNLVKLEEVSAKAKKKNIELTNEELIQREQAKLAAREELQIAKNEAIIRSSQKKSIEAIRAQLSNVTIAWKKLSLAEGENTKDTKSLAAEKLRLTEQLKKVEKATGDARRNVGNYTSAMGLMTKASNTASDSLEGLKKVALRLFIGRTIIDGIRGVVNGLKGLVATGKDSSDAIGGIDKSVTKAQNAFQFAGTTLLEKFAPAINFVANLIAKIPAFFGGISEAATQLSSNLGEVFERAGLRIQIAFLQIEKANPFSDRSTAQINANIQQLQNRILELSGENRGVVQAFKDGYNDTIKAQEAFTLNQEKQAKQAKALAAAEAKRTKELERQKAIQESEITRLKAIITLQEEITKLEVENIKDKQERLLALEDLRIKEEAKIAEEAAKAKLAALDDYKNLELERIKKGSDEEKALVDKIDKEIAEIELLNQKLSEEQLKSSEIRKQEIRKEFALSTEEIAPISVLENKQLKTLLDEKVQLVDEANKDIKDSTDNLVKDLGASFEKLGNFVVEIFDKQAELSGKAVEQQQTNLDRANERAANGLEANIAFEEKALADKQAEQIRRQKEAKIAAEAVALLNLVSAYAQSGDKNALQKGLTDWGILKGLSAILEGFYDGTEDTGTVSNGIDSKGGRLAILHNNERVVTKAQNKLLGGMSNEQLVQNALLGSQMSDYLPTQNAISQNLFDKQKAEFGSSIKAQSVSDSNSLVVKELQQLNRRLSSQPNIGIEIEKVYGNVYDMIKTETKTGMIKRGKKRL